MKKIDITMQLTPSMLEDAKQPKRKELEGHLGTHFDVMAETFPLEYTERCGVIFDAPVRVYSIRNKVQGICFTSFGKVVMSTSYGLADSHYYVYDLASATDSKNTFDGAPLFYLDKLERDIKGPAMAEGLDEYKGKVITLTESASDKYIYGKLFFADKIVALDFNK